ncbi:heterokaryon incompatibility protein-domain-containing protein [Bisporella sp. PMI_857]|nr:heterokaryon incompatibility protein-domain-containing protein [Bisporella sp. PMI_857]
MPFSIRNSLYVDIYLWKRKLARIMLCQMCQTSIKIAFNPSNLDNGSIKASGIIHDLLESFYQSIRIGCFICRQLWVRILEELECVRLTSVDETVPKSYDSFYADIEALKDNIGDADPQSQVRFEAGSTNEKAWIVMRLSGCDVRVDFILWPITPKYVSSALALPVEFSSQNHSTANSTSLWCHWFTACTKSHVTCSQSKQSQSFVPDRLIKLTLDKAENKVRWRLVCGSDTGIVPYLSLSHCWGSSQHTRLEKDKYADFFEVSTDVDLPKTYQDAFKIALSLGCGYIWIDSMCILQDDNEDWRTQSSNMGNIYGNAQCNIAATWGEDGNDGCFSERDTCVIEPTTITLDFTLNNTREYLLYEYSTLHEDVTKAPLNTRAWVMQERYLAKRQLNFAKRQTYWECRELFASEQFPAGVPPEMWNYSILPRAEPSPRLNYENEIKLVRSWCELVEEYSTCSLSHGTDKMSALAGLAGEMRNTTNDIYLAGHWRRNLHRQLCWTHEVDHLHGFTRSRYPSYVAPTWSWASFAGPILMDLFYYNNDFNGTSLVHVKGVSVKAEDPSQLHGFTYLSLTLQGVALSGNATYTGDEDGDHPYKYSLSLYDEVATLGLRLATALEVIILWDENLSSSEKDPDRRLRIEEGRGGNLWFMFIYLGDHWGDQRELVGLVLKQVAVSGEERPSYSRLGSFKAHEPNELLQGKGLGYITDDSKFRDSLDLANPAIADLVHEIIII